MLCILEVLEVAGECADLPLNPSYPIRVVLRALARQCSRLELRAALGETDGKRRKERSGVKGEKGEK